VIPAAVVLVAGGGALAWGAGGTSSGPGYRTAAVTTGTVEQLLTATGTTTMLNQAKARVRTAGTVAQVDVAVGAAVKAGQVLLTLDKTPLTAAVIQAEADLARAKATLETDQASASAATPTAAAPSAGQSSSALQAARRDSDRALAAATTAMRSATKTCGDSTSAQPPPSPLPGPSPSPTAAAGATSCSAALRAVLAAQQRTQQAQQKLQKALNAPSASSASSAAGSDAPKASSAASSGGQSTASRITTDTAGVATAQLALAQAREALGAATVASPIAGTVSAQPFSVGARASAGQAITITGPGAAEVTVDIPAASLTKVKVGQAASVLADGSTTAVNGEVTAISLLPTDSSAYPVTVRVEAPASGFVEGAGASVAILVAKAEGVLTVPNSALTGGAVRTLIGSTVTVTRVRTGARGALVTEVTQGLREGQVVVLADLSRALPTSSTAAGRGLRSGGFTGGPPGAVFQGKPGG
jgi:multidrug efflux pump subunit AcrA (membrane-fusion protein)